MTAVATTASTILCGHGGRVITTGTPKLTVAGAPVLVASGVVNHSIPNCMTPASMTSWRCNVVLAITGPASLATKLNIGGNPVVLAGLAGTTDGEVGGMTPQALLAAIVPQTLLISV